MSIGGALAPPLAPVLWEVNKIRKSMKSGMSATADEVYPPVTLSNLNLCYYLICCSESNSSSLVLNAIVCVIT